MSSIYEKLVKKETKLAVIGLGYVGLPIALEFAKKD
jgi:UDP-N-acetyl-D-galactosamine dehydrogenase